MDKTYLEEQLKIARENYNYFFMKMIVKVLQVCFKLASMLLISEIFNYTIINIIATNYKYIIEDIKKTLKIKEISFEIDLNVIGDNLFKGILNYGK